LHAQNEDAARVEEAAGVGLTLLFIKAFCYQSNYHPHDKKKSDEVFAIGMHACSEGHGRLTL
jgi:hypothetical protein